MDVQKIIDKLKELVRKGNVSRIIINRKDRQILDIPVNVGAVGVVVGLTASKWLLLAAALAAIGSGCTVHVIKSDGGIVNVMDEEDSRKVRDFASDAVEKVKENLPISVSVDIKKDTDIVDAETESVSSDDDRN